jgi:hypothetical protein
VAEWEGGICYIEGKSGEKKMLAALAGRTGNIRSMERKAS